MKYLDNTHDLRLPDWGPYSKKYAGISHISDKENGMRFDLSVFPALYRRKTELPNCLFDGNYHVWKTATDLSYFSTRHELEWKDELYCDVSYSKIDDNSYAIRANCVNNTNQMQNMVVNYMAAIEYPTLNSKKVGSLVAPIKYDLPLKVNCIYATEYNNYKRVTPKHTDSLVADGLRRGEVRKSGFNRGSAISIGENENDKITYTIKNINDYNNPAITIRGLNNFGSLIKITIKGDINSQIEVNASSEIQTVCCPIKITKNDEVSFSVSCNHTFLLDAIIITELSDAQEIKITDLGIDAKPLSFENGETTPVDLSFSQPLTDHKGKVTTLILKYRDSDYYYGLYWNFNDYVIRYLLTDHLDNYIKIQALDHVSKILNGGGNDVYTNVFIRPITLEPMQSADIYGMVCCSKSLDEVKEKLAKVVSDNSILEKTDKEQEKNVALVKTTNEGEKYKFSQDVMLATTFSNIVYPVYAKGNYIKHYTPGKWWDSLYTWDSGFIGLGLSSFDTDRAIDNLNAYLTESTDEECAFIHHGSPVPVQFYLTQEIFNNTQNSKLLKYLYPKLKNYYLFMVGKLGSSVTAKFNSNLLATWDYFYNSGGWDDYPPQMHVHNNKLTDVVSPVITTSMMIRCAKILKQIISLTESFGDDLELYNNDIEKFTDSLNKYSWDSECGYFGYLEHDENHNPTKILRTKNGENFNKGLDGTSPFVAGIVNKEQEEKIIAHLTNENELSTPIGISTVDRSAGYYKNDGYWNGAVWMPHQWFYFKSLLDYGYSDIAYSIAKRGLDIWQNEVDNSYNCFEHFLVQSKRGAGWHHFGGLSTPVLLWYNSYFKPFTVTCGFGGVVKNKNYNETSSSLNCDISFIDNREKTSIIIVMEQGKDYIVKVNSVETNFNFVIDGVIEVTIPTCENQTVNISVQCK